MGRFLVVWVGRGGNDDGDLDGRRMLEMAYTRMATTTTHKSPTKRFGKLNSDVGLRTSDDALLADAATTLAVVFATARVARVRGVVIADTSPGTDAADAVDLTILSRSSVGFMHEGVRSIYSKRTKKFTET